LALIHGISLDRLFGKMREHRDTQAKCPNLVAFVMLL